MEEGARVPRQRRRRSTQGWGRGRRLVVVDVENVNGGPCRSEACATWVRRRLEDVGVLHGSDLVAVAVDESGLASVAWAWSGAEQRWGHGPDGADHALLEVLADRVPERFDEVVVASGDGIFAPAVGDLVAHGVRVVVVAHEVSLHPRLRLAASDVVLLSRRPSSGLADAG